jgi:hypothetical protein
MYELEDIMLEQLLVHVWTIGPEQITHVALIVGHVTIILVQYK